MNKSFLTLASERYSCRSFTQEAVAEEDIQRILEAARLAPSAVNRQPVHIWVVQDKERLQKMKEATAYTYGASVIVIVGCRPEDAWVRKYDGKNGAEMDSAIVGTHIMMEVADLGLGSTWVGSFDPVKLKEAIPEIGGWTPIALFPVGHFEGQPSPRHSERKSIDEMVTRL